MKPTASLLVARGTPVINRLLRRIRDIAEVRADGIVTDEVAHQALGNWMWIKQGSIEWIGAYC